MKQTIIYEADPVYSLWGWCHSSVFGERKTLQRSHLDGRRCKIQLGRLTTEWQYWVILGLDVIRGVCAPTIGLHCVRVSSSDENFFCQHSGRARHGRHYGLDYVTNVAVDHLSWLLCYSETHFTPHCLRLHSVATERPHSPTRSSCRTIAQTPV